MRGRVALIAAGAALVAGCGSDSSPATPAACLGGPGAYLKALQAVPQEVRLGGETPISECLVEEQGAGELAEVGRATVAAATTLNAAGRRAPSGKAPYELGYLVAAVDKGARSTGGIHQDLVRRVETAARFAPRGERLPEEFQRQYDHGLAAGRATG